MEEKENYVNPMKALHSPQMMHDSINLAADEDVLSIKKAEPKVEVVREKMNEVKEEAFPEKLIEVTKEQMISNFIIGTESTLNRMNSAGAALMLRGRVQETEEVIAKIEAVTPEDVLEAARMVLDFEKLSYSAVGNLNGNDFGALVKKAFV